MIKALTQLLTVVGFLTVVGAHAETKCEKLTTFIDHNPTRDYDTLQMLKQKCSHELKYGPSAQLLEISKEIDIHDSLYMAHNNRVDERRDFLEATEEITKPALKSTFQQKIKFSDDSLAKRMQQLSTIAAGLDKLALKPFDSYINPPLLTAVELCQSGIDTAMTQEATSLCETIEGKINQTKTSSDRSIISIDAKSVGAVNAGSTSLGQLRSGISNALAGQLNDEILKSISSRTFDLQQSRAWDLFVINSGANRMLFFATLQLNSGQLTRGLSNLDVLEDLLANFLAILPSRLRNNLENNQSKELSISVEKLRNFAKGLTPPQVESRLRQYIAFKNSQYTPVMSNCQIRHLSQSQNLDKINDDLAKLGRLDVLVPDRTTRIFIISSLAARLDIAIELCGN